MELPDFDEYIVREIIKENLVCSNFLIEIFWIGDHLKRRNLQHPLNYFKNKYNIEKIVK